MLKLIVISLCFVISLVLVHVLQSLSIVTAENVKLGKLFIDYTWYPGSAFLALVHL